MITNATLEDDVKATLALDPRASDPVEIAVAADDGYVTLRGTVGSFAERRAAVKDTRAVDGVYEVNDEIKVRLLDEYQREDTEIRGAAVQILMWDSEVPAELIDVEVGDGWVALTGNADFQFQSDAAFDDVAGMYGVVGVTNEISLAGVIGALNQARRRDSTCRRGARCLIHAPNGSVDRGEIERIALAEALFLIRYADAPT
ncbi:MAG: hypothetical protein QOH68_2382 [Nocardioidaceae bacterium]|nr:hypothetical protein [Nocardioidaceae bacterium]